MTTICKSCNNSDIVLDYRAGDLICRNCGLVIGGRIIDESDETRIYTDDFKQKETRSSGMNEKNGASTTTLSFRGGERDKAALERAQLAEHKLNFDKLQRSSVIISKSLLELCSKMNISKSVQDDAMSLIDRAIMERVARPSLKETVAGACLYLASRMAGYPRCMDEIGAFTGIDSKQLLSLQVSIAKKLQLPPSAMGRLPAEGLLPRIASLAGIVDSLFVLRAREIARRIGASGAMEDVSPQALAAAVLVLVALLSRQAIDLNNLCKAAFASQSSISRVYSSLLSALRHTFRIVTVSSEASHATEKEAGLLPLELLKSFGCSMADFPSVLPKSLEAAVDRSGRTIILQRCEPTSAAAKESLCTFDTGASLPASGDPDSDKALLLQIELALKKEGHNEKKGKSKEKHSRRDKDCERHKGKDAEQDKERNSSIGKRSRVDDNIIASKISAFREKDSIHLTSKALIQESTGDEILPREDSLSPSVREGEFLKMLATTADAEMFREIY